MPKVPIYSSTNYEYDEAQDFTKAKEALNNLQKNFMSFQEEHAQKSAKENLNIEHEFNEWQLAQLHENSQDLDENQRQKFMEMATSYNEEQKNWAKGFASEQKNAYEVETIEQSLINNNEYLSKNITNPNLANSALENIKYSASQLASKQNANQAQHKEFIQKNVNLAIKNAVNSQLEVGKTGYANAIIKQYGNEITDSNKAELQNNINAVRAQFS